MALDQPEMAVKDLIFKLQLVHVVNTESFSAFNAKTQNREELTVANQLSSVLDQTGNTLPCKFTLSIICL